MGLRGGVGGGRSPVRPSAPVPGASERGDPPAGLPGRPALRCLASPPLPSPPLFPRRPLLGQPPRSRPVRARLSGRPRNPQGGPPPVVLCPGWPGLPAGPCWAAGPARRERAGTTGCCSRRSRAGPPGIPRPCPGPAAVAHRPGSSPGPGPGAGSPQRASALKGGLGSAGKNGNFTSERAKRYKKQHREQSGLPLQEISVILYAGAPV